MGRWNKLNGEIEADETYIGGKSKNMHASRRRKTIGIGEYTGKAIVMGVLARGGEVRTAVLNNANRPEIHDVIHKHVEPGSMLYTDSWIRHIEA